MSQNTNNAARAIIIGIIINVFVCGIFWVLSVVFDLGAFLSSCSLEFSRWTAMEFREFVVCPQKVICRCVFTLQLLMIAGAIGAVIVSAVILCFVRNGNLGKMLLVVMMCVSMFSITALSSTYIQSTSTADLYKKFCMVNFRISEFDSSVATEFRYRMSKVQTVADIESVLSEMRFYVLDQERQNKIKESDTERCADDKSE